MAEPVLFQVTTDDSRVRKFGVGWERGRPLLVDCDGQIPRHVEASESIPVDAHRIAKAFGVDRGGADGGSGFVDAAAANSAWTSREAATKSAGLGGGASFGLSLTGWDLVVTLSGGVRKTHSVAALREAIDVTNDGALVLRKLAGVIAAYAAGTWESVEAKPQRWTA